MARLIAVKLVPMAIQLARAVDKPAAVAIPKPVHVR
jgi:hypothetical protein